MASSLLRVANFVACASLSRSLVEKYLKFGDDRVLFSPTNSHSHYYGASRGITLLSRGKQTEKRRDWAAYASECIISSSNLVITITCGTGVLVSCESFRPFDRHFDVYLQAGTLPALRVPCRRCMWRRECDGAPYKLAFWTPKTLAP